MLIYMVELELTERSRRAEWERWHDQHARELTGVDGFLWAQRFRLVDAHQLAYLALYCVARADVVGSASYRAAGGPASASAWRSHLTNWHRNIVETSAPLPDFALGDRLQLMELPVAESPGLPSDAVRLTPVGLDRSFVERAIRLLPPNPEATTSPESNIRPRVFEALSAAHLRPETHINHEKS